MQPRSYRSRTNYFSAISVNEHTVEGEVGAEVADDEEGGVGDPGRQPHVGLARVVRGAVLEGDNSIGKLNSIFSKHLDFI